MEVPSSGAPYIGLMSAQVHKDRWEVTSRFPLPAASKSRVFPKWLRYLFTDQSGTPRDPASLHPRSQAPSGDSHSGDQEALVKRGLQAMELPGRMVSYHDFWFDVYFL